MIALKRSSMLTCLIATPQQQKTKQTAPSSKLHKQQFDELEAPTDCAPLPPVMEQAPSAEPAEHVSIEDRPLRQSESLDLDALLQQLNLVASDLPSEPESESHRNALADLLDSNLGDDGMCCERSLSAPRDLQLQRLIHSTRGPRNRTLNDILARQR